MDDEQFDALFGKAVFFDGTYEVYALEQLGQEQPFSARLVAPADEITPYRWIKAWVTTDTWNEALIAADMLAERIANSLPLGEHELIRRAAQNRTIESFQRCFRLHIEEMDAVSMAQEFEALKMAFGDVFKP